MKKISHLKTFDQRNEESGTGNDRHVTHYLNNEDYLRKNINFYENLSATDYYQEVGEYSYPFEFDMPNGLPSSFEHELGRIRYSIVGTIQVPW